MLVSFRGHAEQIKFSYHAGESSIQRVWKGEKFDDFGDCFLDIFQDAFQDDVSAILEHLGPIWDPMLDHVCPKFA